MRPRHSAPSYIYRHNGKHIAVSQVLRMWINFTKVNRMSNPEERPTGWWKWLCDAAGEVQQKEIAERLGVSPGAVTGWKNGAPPNPASVIAAAREYGPRVGTELADLFLIAYTDTDTMSEEVPKNDGGRKEEPLRPRPDAPPL